MPHLLAQEPVMAAKYVIFAMYVPKPQWFSSHSTVAEAAIAAMELAAATQVPTVVFNLGKMAEVKRFYPPPATMPYRSMGRRRISRGHALSAPDPAAKAA